MIRWVRGLIRRYIDAVRHPAWRAPGCEYCESPEEFLATHGPTEEREPDE